MAEDFLRRPEVKILLDWLQTRGLTLPSNPQDVQKDWSLPFMRWIVSETTNGVDAFLQPEDPPGVLISTHRDIVCDPALYNLTRVEAGRPTTHIVLGSNLAKKEWVKELMSLNKALFIDRNLSGEGCPSAAIGLESKHFGHRSRWRPCLDRTSTREGKGWRRPHPSGPSADAGAGLWRGKERCLCLEELHPACGHSI